MTAPITDVAPDVLEELPPTATFVWYYLYREGKKTQKEVVEETTLCPRTARHVLNELVEYDAVRQWPSTEDARQDYHAALTKQGEPAPVADS